MAGLKGHKRGFLNATIQVALNDHTGLFPLYCEKASDGSLELVVGSYPEPKGGYLTADGKPRDVTAHDLFERDDAVAPEPAKGGEVTRCTLTIRNPASPDTKKFAKDNGHDLDEKRPSLNHLYVKSDAELTDAESLQLKDEVAFMNERNVVVTAGCIIGIHDVSMDGGDNKAYLQCNAENAIELLRDLPFMVQTIQARVRDRKKFVSR